jgi:hypothetical protein
VVPGGIGFSEVEAGGPEMEEIGRRELGIENELF